MKTVDTLVLGGGTAGAVIAGRLAERSRESILVIEAGPDYGAQADGGWPTDLAAGRVIAVQTHDWNYTSASTTGRPNHLLERARVVGGCSSHNGCVAIWGSRVDYDRWAALGNAGWSTDDLLPFFHQVMQQMRVRRFAPEEMTPFHTACLQAMTQSGIPLVDDLNNLDEDVGVSTAPMNLYDAVRWNAAFAYLDPVRPRSNLTIQGNTLVNRLVVVHGRVVAADVIGPNGPETISAGRVILCAGTYGSPAILLRSGIGPADELDKIGIKPVLDRPAVGQNLHDHPAIYLQYRSTAQLSAAMDAHVASGRTLFTEQSLAKLRSAHCSHAFDLHLYPASSPARNANGEWEYNLPIANMTPLSRGSLRLRSANPYAEPIIDTAYLSDADDRDLAVLWSGVEITRGFTRQSPLAEWLVETPESAAIADPESVRRNCMHYYHPVGSCKMGPANDPLAVVDAKGQLYGLQNLFVADASILPIIPRANTNIPTLVAAERIVSWL